MKHAIAILAAVFSALAAAFATYCLLNSVELPVEVPAARGILQPSGLGVFGLSWEALGLSLMGLAGLVGFGFTMMSFLSARPLWRFHVPFWCGLLVLSAALVLVLAGRQWGRDLYGSSDTLALKAAWPVPLEAAILIGSGLVVLTFACVNDLRVATAPRRYPPRQR